MISSAAPGSESGRVWIVLREKRISAKDHRINEGIRVREVRLIGTEGQHVGVVPIQEALRIARENELDLVEVSPTAEPPVCKVMDYGKFLYELAKKEREAKKAQKVIELRDSVIQDGRSHRGFKVRDARRWLELGMKVKVRVHFRGREITYPDIARQELASVANCLTSAWSIKAGYGRPHDADGAGASA
jgi:translation initiation factor IF-3